MALIEQLTERVWGHRRHYSRRIFGVASLDEISDLLLKEVLVLIDHGLQMLARLVGFPLIRLLKNILVNGVPISPFHQRRYIGEEAFPRLLVKLLGK